MARWNVDGAGDLPIPSFRGTYTLILFCTHLQRLKVGKLGVFDFRKGWYAYIGSAFGPGGLRARCLHHLRPALRPRWHIDYLKTVAALKEIWLSTDPVPREHQWANLIGRCLDGATPIPGFGSSDCNCPSHLFCLPQKLSVEKFRRVVWRSVSDQAPISVLSFKSYRQVHKNAL
jgi:Uri superfamily endonuclease